MAKKKGFSDDDLIKKGFRALPDGSFVKFPDINKIVYELANNNSSSLGVDVNEGKAVSKDGGRRMGKKSHKDVQLDIYNEIGFVTLPIKALSINSAFQGRRFKTPEYSSYEKKVLGMLPKIKLDGAPYELTMEFGLSSKLQDLDNNFKLLIDCLVKKYNFDDREIFSIIAKKKIVNKGSEYIKFKLNTIK